MDPLLGIARVSSMLRVQRAWKSRDAIRAMHGKGCHAMHGIRAMMRSVYRKNGAQIKLVETVC